MPIFRRHDEAPRERTNEDRERARAERAARRAGRPLPPRDAPVAPTTDFEAVLDEPPEVNGASRSRPIDRKSVV